MLEDPRERLFNPGVQCLEGDESSVQQSEPSELQELREARHSGMLPLATFYKLLSGYGTAAVTKAYA